MRKEGSMVYVLHNTLTGYTKIGVTGNIKSRVRNLEMASGCKLTICFVSHPTSIAYELEGELHQHFDKYRVIGEWFDCDNSRIIEVVKEKCKEIDGDERIKLYREGKSITKIAGEVGMSRQAVSSYLKRKGVIDEDRSKKEIVEIEKEVKVEQKKRLKIDMEEAVKASQRKPWGRFERIAPNLYSSGSKFMVKYYKDGEIFEEMYDGIEELNEVYGS